LEFFGQLSAWFFLEIFGLTGYNEKKRFSISPAKTLCRSLKAFFLF